MPAARQLKPVEETREVTVEFDPQNLTIDEIEEFEQLTGDDFEEAFRPQPIFVDGKPLTDGNGQLMFREQQKTKHLKAVMLLMLKRTNPDATMADVGKLRLRDIVARDLDPEGKGPRAPESAPSSPSSSA